jgi:hypothetical protein
MASKPPKNISANEARTPQRVSIRTIFNVVKAIGFAGEEAEKAFLAMCDRDDLRIVVEPKVINLVKRFLLEQDVHRGPGPEALNTLTRDVIVSPGGRCP